VIVAWRLIKARNAATAFDGEGARVEGGRWNPRGVPVVYLSDHPALAALEIFVHLKGAAAKIKFALFRVEIPAEVPVLELAVADLPAGWRNEPPTPGTMAVGEKWVGEGKAAVLKVPSVLVPAAANLVLNPRHPDAPKVRIGPAENFSFDPRMWK
jgi:RES domain-containing protein